MHKKSPKLDILEALNNLEPRATTMWQGQLATHGVEELRGRSSSSVSPTMLEAFEGNPFVKISALDALVHAGLFNVEYKTFYYVARAHPPSPGGRYSPHAHLPQQNVLKAHFHSGHLDVNPAAFLE